jgi:formate-nitrite transporter family protein
MCSDAQRWKTGDVTEAGEARALSLTANQSRFRTLNDRLSRAADSYHFETGVRVPFTCECPDPGCCEVVMLSLHQYEHVRAHPTWFLLVAGHEDDESAHERVIEAESGYAIVEKVGAAAVEAAQLDPRQTA